MEDKVICPRCGDEISLTGTHRCVEHPAHREVKVEQRHRDAARDIYVQIVTNPSLAEVDKEDEIAFEVARFEASLTTPPDQPRIGDTLCKGSWLLGTACGKCKRCEETKPDILKPDLGHAEIGANLDQSGRVEVPLNGPVAKELLRAVMKHTELRDPPRYNAPALANDAFLVGYRAAIAAMPKEDIWEEAARIAADYETQLSAPLASEEYRRGFEAGADDMAVTIAAALRDRRAK